METKDSRFGKLDFSSSGEYLEKNQKFFEALEKDPRVFYYYEESDEGTYFDILEGTGEAIPVPVFFEILGREWDKSLTLQEVTGLIAGCGVQIDGSLHRRIWDADRARCREAEEAARWTKIECKKGCQSVYPYYHDIMTYHKDGEKNTQRCCYGATFWCWCVPKVQKEKSTSFFKVDRRTVLTTDGDRAIRIEHGFWYCEVPEEAKINPRIVEVRPGDTWICPYRRQCHTEKPVPNVVILLPGGYSQVNDENGRPKAVISPTGQLTEETTVDILVPLPENDQQGIVYSRGVEREGFPTLLERFLMLTSVQIVEEICDGEHLLRSVPLNRDGSGNEIATDGRVEQIYFESKQGYYTDGRGGGSKGLVQERRVRVTSANWIIKRRWWNGGERKESKIQVRRSWLVQEVSGQESPGFRQLALVVGLIR
jgi:hypothetical protein